jgi:SOS-response transcriptional repressor LexA
MSHAPHIGLTPRMAQLRDYIKVYADEHNVSPSYTQMMEALSLKSKSGVNRLLNCLEQRGHVQRVPRLARSVTIRQPQCCDCGSRHIKFALLDDVVAAERAP